MVQGQTEGGIILKKYTKPFSGKRVAFLIDTNKVGRMKIQYRSHTSTMGRKMAGARSLWRANGMKEDHFGKPVFGIANSFTQFVPGHAHLHHIGQ